MKRQPGPKQQTAAGSSRTSGTRVFPSRSTARVPRGPAGAPRSRLDARKAPGQDRSRATVEAILEAAAREFANEGYARTSTNGIARRAGVSVGSLYQYFPNKDAILNALLTRHLADVEGVITQSLDEVRDFRVPLREVFQRMLDRFLALHEGDPLLTRAVEQQVGQMPRLPDSHHQAEQEYVASLAQALESRPDVRRGDRTLMATLLFEVAETLVAWLAHGAGRTVDRQQAIVEAAEVMSCYVEVR